MKPNERIFVENYFATTHEDDPERGEIGGFSSMWTARDLPVEGGFASVSDALRAICAANCFDFSPDRWQRFDDEPGRFDFCVSVDDDNCEACAADFDAWRRGERKLYNCDISAYLAVRSVRQLTEEEAAI